MHEITGPLGARFGRDPFAFAIAAVREHRAHIIQTINRTSERTGQKSWHVPSGEGRELEAKLTADATDSDAMLALTAAMWSLRAPHVFQDEARRVVHSLPQGLDNDASGDSAPDADRTSGFFGVVSELGATAIQTLPNLIEVVRSELTKAPEGSASERDKQPAKADYSQYLVPGAVGAVVLYLVFFR